MTLGSLELLPENRIAEPRELEAADERRDFTLDALVDLSQSGGGRQAGAALGVWAAVDEAGSPLVDYAANPCGGPIAAVSTVSLQDAAVGAEVALLFIEGDLRRPLIVGLIQPPLKESAPAVPPALAAEADGDRLEITAQREIVLRCGEASITLTRAGKIILRGAYLLSRSSGVNRIKGGSVQIN